MYDREIEIIGRNIRLDDLKRNSVVDDAVHYMNLFTFHDTTPATRVGNYIKGSFYSASSDQGLLLLTSKGVRSSKEARIGHRDLQFLKQTALVTNDLASLAKGFIDSLKHACILKVAGWADVLAELSTRCLNEIEAKQFLRWLINEKPSQEIQNRLLSVGRLIRGDGKLVTLSQVTSYIVRGKFPEHGQLSTTVLPFDVSRHLQTRELDSLYKFLHWFC